jgi:glycosyltransferase involved in cell wall biosynthesis
MKLYKREADVIYPPVDVDRFSIGKEKKDFYITISRLVSYKKVDLIVRAFNRLPDRDLVVIGDGPEMKSLKKIASSNIIFMGFQPEAVIEDMLKQAKAFVYAAEEDFGIVPVEAQACGIPVIAYGKGGVLETVVEGETGFFFEEQNETALIEAINAFERSALLDPEVIRQNAERFNKARFLREMKSFVEEKSKAYFKGTPNKSDV